MLIFGVVVICVILFVLALLLPRFSRKPQSAVDRGFGAGARVANKAPNPIGRWFAKPFHSGRRAADKSAAAGRKTRAKLPG